MRCRRKYIGPVIRAVILPLLVIGALLCFFTALSDLSRGTDGEGRQQLDLAVRRAAVACYAAEGIYPPDLQYLEDHYGLQLDSSRYTVFYDAFAENLMPDITVVEARP